MRHLLANSEKLRLAARKEIKNVMATSVPMQTIDDDQLFDEVSLASKGLKAKPEDRVPLTFKYNAEISNSCIIDGAFINLAPHLFYNSCRHANKCFLIRDAYDHHLDSLKTGHLQAMGTSIYLD